jgi:hypothetical protein
MLREISTVQTEPFQRAISELEGRRVQRALQGFREAEFLGENPKECAAQRWYCWMLLGEFEQAWKESDAIASFGADDPHALWDGKPFTGKRVIIRCLHGFGDAIQFLRYAKLIRESARHVIVETHPEMVSLLAGLPFVDEVIPWSNRRDWDQQIEVTELPRAFRTLSTTVPCFIPYFQIGIEERQRSRRMLVGNDKWHLKRPRIGLLWEASSWNPARSASLNDFRPLFDAPCSFYSFQRGPAREQIADFCFRNRLHDTAEHSPGIADTAADLTNMDLLITVDTMAAHLGGALGLPVFTLLPWAADWRWMIDRNDTPWYPTMQLFRQITPGDWSDPVNRVAQAIQKLLISDKSEAVSACSNR